MSKSHTPPAFTPEWIAEQRKLYALADIEPCRAKRYADFFGVYIEAGERGEITYAKMTDAGTLEIGEYLAAAANHYPDALAEIERLRARVEQAEGELTSIKADLSNIGYVVEEEGEGPCVECEYCGFPIAEGHADDCRNEKASALVLAVREGRQG